MTGGVRAAERVLVLGAGGMLGHKMTQVLGAVVPETWAALHGARAELAGTPAGVFDRARIVEGVDAADLPALGRLLEDVRPDVVVNCVGVIKQRDAAKAAIPSITINALLPHHLAAAIAPWGGRLVHFSTDCVFSGQRGDYDEADVADATDLYGRTKLLGEVEAPNALVLRTSIIGRELRHHRSLLDWFLAQRGGTVRGFRRAWWSGVPTVHLARLVARLVTERPGLAGVYQVSGGRIAKYDLLLLLRDAFAIDVDVEPEADFFCDRSLRGDRLREATGYTAPSYEALVAELVADAAPFPLPPAAAAVPHPVPQHVR